MARRRTLNRRSALRLLWGALIGLLTLALGCGGSESPADTPGLAAVTVAESLRSESPWIRAETVRLLGLAGANQFRSELDGALSDNDAMVQAAAIEALLRAGVRSVEEPALSRLIAGNDEQRIRMLAIVVASARAEFRQEVVRRAILDVKPEIQATALRLALRASIAVPVDQVARLVISEDAALSESAFLAMAATDRQAALDFLLAGMRDTSAVNRMRAMRLARQSPSANLWPAMRSYARQDRDADARRFALLTLGYLGDPIAEGPIREILLATSDEKVAADALRALARIPTERARDQPLIHRRDHRDAVREASLDELIRQRRPPDDFEVFLSDRSPAIAERALAHMLRADPHRAAALFARVLDESSDPLAPLDALYRVSVTRDIRRFIDAASGMLGGLTAHEDPRVAGLAARLMLAVTGDDETDDLLRRARGSEALYAALEASLTTSGDHSARYADAIEHDLVMVRTAAAIGVLRMGDRFVAPIQ